MGSGRVEVAGDADEGSGVREGRRVGEASIRLMRRLRAPSRACSRRGGGRWSRWTRRRGEGGVEAAATASTGLPQREPRGRESSKGGISGADEAEAEGETYPLGGVGGSSEPAWPTSWMSSWATRPTRGWPFLSFFLICLCFLFKRATELFLLNVALCTKIDRNKVKLHKKFGVRRSWLTIFRNWKGQFNYCWTTR